MSTIKIEDVGQNTLDRVNKILGAVGNGGAAVRAVYQAAKRAGQRGRTEASRFAGAEYTIGSGGFLAHCKIKVNASGGGGGASSVSIVFAGSVIPLIEFNTHWSKGGGLTTTVKSGSTATLAHAFAAPVYGATQAHEHKNGTTGGVETLYGPSTGQMMQNEKIIQQMDKVISETFEQRIDHEISRILAGL